MHPSLQSLPLLLALLLAAPILSAGGCEPSRNDDDDDATAQPIGRVTVQPGGMVFDSLQEAIDAAAEGGTVVASAGVYEESLTITKSLTLSGDGVSGVLVTGNGSGTMLEIDQVDGPVQVSGMSFLAPSEEAGTIRGLRVTNSTDVLIHDVIVGFDDGGAAGCEHGLVGIESSQATVTVSEAQIVCVGFENEAGGTGILAQTDSVLTVVDTTINAMGAFGIRSIDSELSISSSTITTINRSPLADQYESDGTGIYFEQGTTELSVTDTTVENGAFVGVWVDGPAVRVTDSSIAQFAYGVYHPGDSALASGRSMTVENTTFRNLAQEAILSVASTSVSGSVFLTKGVVPDPLGSPAIPYGGIRVIAPSGVVTLVDNQLDGMGRGAINVLGNNDGDVALATINGNEISRVTAGSGIVVSDTQEAVLEGNIIADIDHATDDDGGISNGYGLACFRVASCAMNGNDVSEAEFSNFVGVDSNFTSVADSFHDGWYQGAHLESSQGTFTDTTFTDNRGYGAIFMDSTVQGTGVVVTGTVRGPHYRDLDGVDDPSPEDLEFDNGGRGIESFSTGGASFLSWSSGTFEDNHLGALYSGSGQVEFVDNRLINNGIDDPVTGFGGGSALVISGSDAEALQGPLVQGNVIDGSEGGWGMSVSNAPGVRISDNVICGGTSAGLYLSRSDGAVVEDNHMGRTDDTTVTSCGVLGWVYGIYFTNSQDSIIEEGIRLSGNDIADGDMDYGVYLNGSGPIAMEENTIEGATVAGVYATTSTPSGLTWDDDGDGQSESSGDCDDTNPQVNGNAQELDGDGIDNNCDGVIDDGLSTSDGDGDGHSIADGDCNDNDASVYPGAVELLENFRDDNCDGWADFDADLPHPQITMMGNTIEGGSAGIRLNGATLDMSVEASAGSGDQLVGQSGTGLMLWSWSYASTPALVPSVVNLGPEVVIDGSQSDCISVAGTSATVNLDGASVTGCGASGISMTQAGVLNAEEVTIENTVGPAIYQFAGVANLDQVSLSSPGGLETLVGTEPLVLSAAGGELGFAASRTPVAIDQPYSLLLNGVALTEGEDFSLNPITGYILLTEPLAAGDALSLSSYSWYRAAVELKGGELNATDLVIVEPSGMGLHVTGGAANVDLLSLNFTSGNSGSAPGVLVEGGAISLLNAAIGEAPGSGLHLTGGTVSVEGGVVAASSQDGIAASGGVLALDGVLVLGNGGNGVHLSGTAQVTMENADLSNNTGYGLLCDGGSGNSTVSTVGLLSCEAAVSDNVAGDFELQNGCEATDCIVL